MRLIEIQSSMEETTEDETENVELMEGAKTSKKNRVRSVQGGEEVLIKKQAEGWQEAINEKYLNLFLQYGALSQRLDWDLRPTQSH